MLGVIIAASGGHVIFTVTALCIVWTTDVGKTLFGLDEAAFVAIRVPGRKGIRDDGLRHELRICEPAWVGEVVERYHYQHRCEGRRVLYQDYLECVAYVSSRSG
jgi:hypothetical protein